MLRLILAFLEGFQLQCGCGQVGTELAWSPGWLMHILAKAYDNCVPHLTVEVH